jgi:multidrug efflux pump subunit AcrA (membrane-fusion protein)
LADLYSAGAFEARVPVTLEELGYLDEGEIIGSSVLIKASLGGKERLWQGSVIRNESLVDQQTMTVYLVVSINAAHEEAAYRLPPLGLFVEAEIQGRKIDRVMKIPRSALRADNTLLTVNSADELDVVSVYPLRTLSKSVLISNGLKDGARVIVSPMETPVPGMKLAVQK